MNNQKLVNQGILAEIADVETGRVKEFNKDYANDLKARVRAGLIEKQPAPTPIKSPPYVRD